MSTELSRLVPTNDDGKYSRVEQQSGGLNRTGPIKSEEGQSCMGDWFKSLVFGGFDGTISSLIITSAGTGGGLDWQTTFVLGFTYIATNSIYMGISEFLSAKAHREFLQSEKRRAMWEFKNFKEDEIHEMINKFELRGMTRKDAELVVNKMAQYENFFVGAMVVEELGQQLPINDEEALFITDSLIMFLSYLAIGSLSLILLAGGNLYLPTFSSSDVYTTAVTFSCILLSIFGLMKSFYSSSHWLYSLLEGLFLGILTCILSYFIADSIADLLLS